MAASVRPNELRHLDPAVVARIESLELRARTVVEGFLIGLHRSPFQGFSVEFSEYRQYMPGDDLSTLDWKVYGRSDRFYVKRYEEETNLDCRILLDVSASMAYGSGGVTKHAYAVSLAASLAYLMHRQRDAVGLVAFDDDIATEVPVSGRPGHLRRVLAALDRLETGRRSDVARPLTRLAEALDPSRAGGRRLRPARRAVEAVVRGLRHLRSRGADVIVLHVLDPGRAGLPLPGVTRFRDLETGAEVRTLASRVRAPYREAMRGLIAAYERDLRLADVDYHRLDTSKPLDAALQSYLAARARRP